MLGRALPRYSAPRMQKSKKTAKFYASPTMYTTVVALEIVSCTGFPDPAKSNSPIWRIVAGWVLMIESQPTLAEV